MGGWVTEGRRWNVCIVRTGVKYYIRFVDADTDEDEDGKLGSMFYDP